MRFLVLACASTVIACAPEQTMTAYAREFAQACEPGPHAREFVSGSAGKAPDVRLVSAYRNLRSVWVYSPDPPDLDTFADAEAIFRSSSFMGDCEDFGATLAAACRALNLTCRLALGETDRGGHAWLEVRISDTDSALAADLGERMGHVFQSSASVVTRPDGLWLQLSPEGTLDSYQVTHFIDTSGKLKSLEQTENR